MATLYFSWGDGTADKIGVTYTGDVGTSQLSIFSDRNKTLNSRSRSLQLKSTSGILLATLTINQSPRSRAYNVAFSKNYK